MKAAWRLTGAIREFQFTDKAVLSEDVIWGQLPKYCAGISIFCHIEFQLQSIVLANIIFTSLQLQFTVYSFFCLFVFLKNDQNKVRSNAAAAFSLHISYVAELMASNTVVPALSAAALIEWNRLRLFSYFQYDSSNISQQHHRVVVCGAVSYSDSRVSPESLLESPCGSSCCSSAARTRSRSFTRSASEVHGAYWHHGVAAYYSVRIFYVSKKKKKIIPHLWADSHKTSLLFSGFCSLFFKYRFWGFWVGFFFWLVGFFFGCVGCSNGL